MSLSPLELERLAEEVAGRVTEKLSNQPRLVDRYRLAELLGVSVPSIERWIQSGEIPVVRIGRRTLFDVAEVIAAGKKKGGAAHG